MSDLKILCVDDEPAILSSLKQLFRRYGVDISTANGGDDALDMLQQEHYDLIISDIHMPGMSGCELLTKVDEQWPDIAKIALTGYTELSDADEIITDDIDIDAYLYKPWHDADLVNTVSYILQEPFESQ